MNTNPPETNVNHAIRTSQRSLVALAGILLGGVLFAAEPDDAPQVSPAKSANPATDPRAPVQGAYTQTFEKPVQLGGVSVVGWVSFYSAKGNVEFAKLASDQVAWGKTRLPAGTAIKFTPEGKPKWCFLAKDCEINGHLFRGGGHDWMTEFHPGGELASGGLVNVETIDGIPCENGAKILWKLWKRAARTSFYPDGKLKSAWVAKTVTWRGQTLKAGKRVNLKPDGSIESIE